MSEICWCICNASSGDRSCSSSGAFSNINDWSGSSIFSISTSSSLCSSISGNGSACCGSSGAAIGSFSAYACSICSNFYKRMDCLIASASSSQFSWFCNFSAFLKASCSRYTSYIWITSSVFWFFFSVLSWFVSIPTWSIGHVRSIFPLRATARHYLHASCS